MPFATSPPTNRPATLPLFYHDNQLCQVRISDSPLWRANLSVNRNGSARAFPRVGKYRHGTGLRLKPRPVKPDSASQGHQPAQAKPARTEPRSPKNGSPPRKLSFFSNNRLTKDTRVRFCRTMTRNAGEKAITANAGNAEAKKRPGGKRPHKRGEASSCRTHSNRNPFCQMRR